MREQVTQVPTDSTIKSGKTSADDGHSHWETKQRGLPPWRGCL